MLDCQIIRKIVRGKLTEQNVEQIKVAQGKFVWTSFLFLLDLVINQPQYNCMKHLKYILLNGIVLLLSASPALAALENPLGTGATIPILIGRIIRAILGLSGVVALLMFVYGGVLYLISAGDSKKVQKGKDTFTHAVIGLVIIFTAYTLVDFVIKALKGTV